VILDGDHSATHVLAELEAYSDLVPIGGYLIVKDGVVDELPRFREHRPGPLVAIRQFVARDHRFVIDKERSGKFLFHYSPDGCLRRIR
jgi:cephalosporin hydroxylase